MWTSNHFSTFSCFPPFSRSRFFMAQVFQGLGFSGSRFLRVQVLGPSFSGSGSRVRVQVLEVTFTEVKSKRRQRFYKIGVLKYFTKLSRKHPWHLLFNKAAAQRTATKLQKRLQHRCFRINFARILRTSILYYTSQ